MRARRKHLGMVDALLPDAAYPVDREILSPFNTHASSPESPISRIHDGESSTHWQSDEEDLFAEGGAGDLQGNLPVKGLGDGGTRRPRRLWWDAGRRAGEAADEEVLLLDNKYRELVRRGRLVEASEYLEKSLFARLSMYGAESAEVERAARALVTHYNTGGMMALQAGNFKLSFKLLRKADVITGKDGPLHASADRRRLRAVALNNLGCFYRRRKKLHSSLRCLERALELELAIDGPPIAPAGTHLNICAVLSELRHHEAALVHANAALSLLLPLYGDACGCLDDSIFSQV